MIFQKGMVIDHSFLAVCISRTKIVYRYIPYESGCGLAVMEVK